ncbi:unnamed protein product [Spodoptera exigua]|nr:unnamed protein product [Spodoptera exigua]
MASYMESEYALMPPVIQLDSYENCTQDAKWLYCKAEFVLVSDEYNPRLAMIELYFFGPMPIILNGPLIIQTFLVISSFLLIFIWLKYSEKNKPSWKMIPIQFLMRWTRLTPSYAIVLALTASKFGRISSQPNWKIVGNEIADCRRDWWKHLLYINNYFDNSEYLYRSIIEWRFWRIPSQLSYSAYLLHFFFVRKYAVTLTSTRVVSAWTVMYDVHIVIVHTMLAATVFWLLVDAPLANLRQYFFKTNIFEEKKKVK